MRYVYHYLIWRIKRIFNPGAIESWHQGDTEITLF